MSSNPNLTRAYIDTYVYIYTYIHRYIQNVKFVFIRVEYVSLKPINQNLQNASPQIHISIFIFCQLTVILRSGVTGQSVTRRATKLVHDPAPTLPHRMAV